jgi:hypothetical protein
MKSLLFIDELFCLFAFQSVRGMAHVDLGAFNGEGRKEE